MKHILVTGGLGFIGHNVVKQLQAEHEVTVIDSCTDYGILQPDELALLIAERRKGIDGKIVVDDIRNYEVMKDLILMDNPDVVVHLASFPRAKVVNNDPVLGSETMINALVSMLKQCKEGGVKRFVYVSSSMVYGDFDNASET